MGRVFQLNNVFHHSRNNYEKALKFEPYYPLILFNLACISCNENKKAEYFERGMKSYKMIKSKEHPIDGTDKLLILLESEVELLEKSIKQFETDEKLIYYLEDGRTFISKDEMHFMKLFRRNCLLLKLSLMTCSFQIESKNKQEKLESISGLFSSYVKEKQDEIKLSHDIRICRSENKKVERILHFLKYDNQILVLVTI